MEIKRKVYYFADYPEYATTLEKEFEITIASIAAENGITFANVHCTEIPPFGETYSILFFDWGGMSLGNSMLDTFCDYITDEAKDNPSKDYIMSSQMTTYAMKDALDRFREVLPNVYLTVEDWCHSIKKSV